MENRDLVKRAADVLSDVVKENELLRAENQCLTKRIEWYQRLLRDRGQYDY